MEKDNIILDKKDKVVLDKKEDNEAITKDLSIFFDNLITKGKISKTVELSDNLTIEIRTLDTWETLMADARIPLNIIGAASDVSARARYVSILASATVSINGIDINQDSLTSNENARRIDEVYKKYMELPPALLDLLKEEYDKLVEKQMEFYKKPEEVIENIENF